MKKIIKIQYRNGINQAIAEREILTDLLAEFIFQESSQPDFILFGPYGNDIPPPGNYIRIGYFCENMTPDLSICEWAFGIPKEDEIKKSNYKRIQWHGLDPNLLVKRIDDNEIDKIIHTKSKFCNFLYSHKVPYREEFFRQLSKYKKIDAPGKSMNNLASIDDKYEGTIWERKKQFISDYKFTIAFENYCYPGYQTEKLYDAMQCNSIPLYCGDPHIGDIFNKKSFLNASDYLPVHNNGLISFLEKTAQMNFIDMRPQFLHQPQHRLQRKLKAWGRSLKMELQFNRLNFDPLIERIIEIDSSPEKYKKMLEESWFVNNVPPLNLSTKSRWETIFNSI